MKIKFLLYGLFLVLTQNYIFSQEVKNLWQPYYITPRTGNQHIDLSADWALTYLDTPIQSIHEVEKADDWITVDYPTSVQWALHKAGKLPHPYEHENSFQYRWI